MAIPLVRGTFDAAVLSGFGSLLFWVWVLPRSRAQTPADTQAVLDRRLLRTIRISLAAIPLAGLAWLVLEAGAMADADGPAQLFAALPTVLTATAFGHLLLLQGAGVALATVALDRDAASWQRHLALAAAGVVLLLQVGHGHAWSMRRGLAVLPISEALHLLAGAIWLGGLLPLLLAVRAAPPRAGATAAHAFSIIGKWCVVVMAATALVQATILVGGLAALFGTSYGRVACLKLSLFGVLLGFACVNRYRLAPALLGGSPEAARRHLVGSIAVQTGFGMLVLLAAGLLASLPPAMHAPS